ncbi:MAG: zinc-binding dehydrogenase [Bacteroidetes bacterium]|nr:zinc-binding dehydrogenase [Fibrella sp.]
MNKRIVIKKTGGIDALELIEEPLPILKVAEVRVRVRASGVAFGDILLRKGAVPGTSYPVTPGYDIVGEVEAIGTAVTRFKTGDLVAGLPVTGGYTTFICLPETELVPVPAHLPPAKVVSVLLNYTTAFRLLTKAANLKAGNSVLVHGAAGGVGTAVLQVGKVLGIRVYGTVSTAKMAVVKQQGGIPVDHTRTDFVAEIRRLTGEGVDAVLDPIGGTNLSRSYDALNERGTLVLFGVSSSLEGGGNPTVKTLKTMARWLFLKLRFDARRVVTSFISSTDKGVGIYDDMAMLIQLLDEGKIKPVIAKTFPLAEAGKAQAMLEQEKPVGKLVLIP